MLTAMSLDYYVALCGPLPDVARLNADLDDFDGVTGTWPGLDCGGVQIQKTTLDDEQLAMLHDAMREDGHTIFDFESSVVLRRASFDTASQIADALMEGIGGVLFSEDCEIVEVYPPELAREPRPPKPPREPIALDFSIPSDVEAHFVDPQQKYYLATRVPITASFAKAVKAMDPPNTLTIRGARDASWDDKAVGPLVVKSTREYGWYKSMLTRIALAKPHEILWISHTRMPGPSLTRIGAEIRWTSPSRMPEPVEPEIWRMVLQMMCALARNTTGVLVNEDAHHDFSVSVSRRQ
jgi:hypothetical protein